MDWIGATCAAGVGDPNAYRCTAGSTHLPASSCPFERSILWAWCERWPGTSRYLAVLRRRWNLSTACVRCSLPRISWEALGCSVDCIDDCQPIWRLVLHRDDLDPSRSQELDDVSPVLCGCVMYERKEGSGIFKLLFTPFSSIPYLLHVTLEDFALFDPSSSIKGKLCPFITLHMCVIMHGLHGSSFSSAERT